MKIFRHHVVLVRWMMLALGISAAACLTIWTIKQWSQHTRRQRAVRILEDLRLIDHSKEPLDLITGRSNVCEVDGVEMSVETIAVEYGLMESSHVNTRSVLATPHARWPYAGGCVVLSAPFARAYICPQCVARSASMSPNAGYVSDVWRGEIRHEIKRATSNGIDADDWLAPQAILPKPTFVDLDSLSKTPKRER